METQSKTGQQPLEVGYAEEPTAPEIGLMGALAKLKTSMDEAKNKRQLMPTTQLLRPEKTAPTRILSSVKPDKIKEERPLTIAECPESQNKLTELLKQVFLVQKGYGEKAQDAAVRDAAFQWKLGRFNYQQVLWAFNEYTDRNSDLPAPADIINLIDPEPEPLSAAVYVNYKKMAALGVYLLPSERAYCSAFESQEKEKMRGGSQALMEAQREIEGYTRLLESIKGVRHDSQ